MPPALRLIVAHATVSLIRPESIKDMQRNWIGRSEGAQFGFEVLEGCEARGKRIEVYTTRPDTIFGATYVVIAPEHQFARQLATDGQRDAVAAYIDASSRKSELERTELSKEKTGVLTGSFVKNPATGEAIPVWVAGAQACCTGLNKPRLTRRRVSTDYVLGGYGCGAIMAVPAHDARDFEFATAFKLDIKPVVSSGSAAAKYPFAGDGTLVNSSNTAAGLDLNGAALWPT